MGVDKIIAGLSEATKTAIRQCRPWDVEVGAGAAVAMCANDLLQDSTICDDGVELNQRGLAVRARLLEQGEG